MILSSQDKLLAFKPRHRFFVGIDSDGCVFDTMEIKHKECFVPNIIKYWKLQAVSKYARGRQRALVREPTSLYYG